MHLYFLLVFQQILRLEAMHSAKDSKGGLAAVPREARSGVRESGGRLRRRGLAAHLH